MNVSDLFLFGTQSCLKSQAETKSPQVWSNEVVFPKGTGRRRKVYLGLGFYYFLIRSAKE